VHYCVAAGATGGSRPAIFFADRSGAQYEDGTTDVTTPSRSATHRRNARPFHRVLRGHVAIARAIFPDGTTGAQLDWRATISLAGRPDFEHLGYRARRGSYLSVHEGLARLLLRH
jgi:Xaa-Pro aminopeptidase